MKELLDKIVEFGEDDKTKLRAYEAACSQAHSKKKLVTLNNIVTQMLTSVSLGCLPIITIISDHESTMTKAETCLLAPMLQEYPSKSKKDVIAIKDNSAKFSKMKTR